MITDRVGDFIIRLQNAALVGKRVVDVPHSLHLEAIAKKLKELGFIESVQTEGEVKKVIKIALAFDAAGRPIIRGVKRLSRPGQRLYIPSTDAHTVAGGTGARIVSTSSGILSDKEARRDRKGGETLFEIW